MTVESRGKNSAPALARSSWQFASILELVGAKRMNGRRRRADSSATMRRKPIRSYWIVRMTGTPSADHEPIWIVFGRGNVADLESRAKALQMARANLDQLTSKGVISAVVNWM